MTKHTTPSAKTQDASEREHCEQLARDYYRSRGLRVSAKDGTLRDLLLRERAAARAEVSQEFGLPATPKKYPVNCEQCGVEATQYTIDGAESKMICDAWPKCAPPAETVGDAESTVTIVTLKSDSPRSAMEVLADPPRLFSERSLTPPAPTQDEREHCERVAWRYIEQASSDAEDKELSTYYADLLLRERAAARAEKEAQCDAHMEAFRVLSRNYDAADQVGYERGRAEQSEHTASALELGDKAGYERGSAEGRKAREDILRAHVEQQDKIEDTATQVREYRDRCDADITALQAKYDRLAAAARAYLKAKNSAGANEVLARETELIAALELGDKAGYERGFADGQKAGDEP